MDERKELSQKILAAPELRVSHILHHVDKLTNELKAVAEAMALFCRGGRRLLRKTILATFALSLFSVFFLDMTVRELAGVPQETFLSALYSGTLAIHHFLIPVIGLVAGVLFMGFLFTKWFLSRYAKKYRKNVDRLFHLDTPYREHAWSRAKNHVLNLLQKIRVKGLFASHRKNQEVLERFLKKDLQAYFETVR